MQGMRGIPNAVDVILEGLAEPLLVVDRHWRIVRTNSAAEDLLDQQRQGLLGCQLWERFPEAESFRSRYEEAMREQRRVEFEQNVPSLGMWVEVHAFPSPPGLSIHLRNISQRKRLERERDALREELAREADRTKRLLELGASISAAHTVEHVTNVIVRGAASFLDAQAALLVLVDPAGQEFKVVPHGGRRGLRPALAAVSYPVVEDVVRRGAPVFLRDPPSITAYFGSTAAEVDTHVGALLALPLLSQRAVVGALVAAFDRPHAFDALEPTVLLGLAAHCAQALGRAHLYDREATRAGIAEDRERIARDLHDTVIQRVFATGIDLRRTLRALEDREEVRMKVEASVTALDAVVREIRSTIFDLQVVDERSRLTERLSNVVEDAAITLGFAPVLEVEGDVDSLPGAEIAAHLVLVLTEALTNAARHARASNVRVQLWVGPEVSLTVCDDGVGIDEGAVKARGGLHNIKERARLLGGSARIARRDRGGTELRWSVPRQGSCR